MRIRRLVAIAALAGGLSAPTVLLAQTSGALRYPFELPLSRAAPAVHKAGGAQVDSVDLDKAQASDLALQGQLDTVLTHMGLGYSSFSRKTRGDCVDGTVVGPTPGAKSVDYSLKVLNSYEEFSNETAAEASISTSWPSFSASVKSKFDQARRNNHAVQFLLLREKVQLQPDINLRGATLNASVPSPSSDAANFYARCGDAYIAQFQMGGELFALLTIDETSDQLKSQLNIQGEASGFNTNASASFTQTLESLRKTGRTEMSVQQLGGNGASMPTASLDALSTYSKDFPTQITPATSVPVGFTTKGYDTLISAMDVTETLNSYGDLANKGSEVTATILALRAEQSTLDRFAAPRTRAAGDIRDTIANRLRTADADQLKIRAALTGCAQAFWVTDRCNFGTLAGYEPPKTPAVIVQRMDPRSGGNVNVNAPAGMMVEFRGAYCWDGESCDTGRDGVTNSNLAWVSVNGQRYRGGPIQVPAGQVVLRCVDTEYGDNGGELYAVLYEPRG
jgi:hypothetical protein